MSYDHRDMNGTLFVNDYKEKDSQPDYRGDCKIHDEVLSISGWKKESSNGKIYLSLAFSVPREQSASAPPAASDEMPF